MHILASNDEISHVHCDFRIDGVSQRRTQDGWRGKLKGERQEHLCTYHTHCSKNIVQWKESIASSRQVELIVLNCICHGVRNGWCHQLQTLNAHKQNHLLGAACVYQGEVCLQLRVECA